MRLSKSKNGFTLVELLVVIAIISILAILGGANYITSLKRGRDATRKSDLEQVRSALEMYRTDNSAYPTVSGADNQEKFTELVKDGGVLRTSPNIYLNKTIVDPTGSGGGYEYILSGSTYELCATLEITPSTPTCTSGSGNYGVLNP